MQERLKKLRREPDRIGPRQITPRALEILYTILRYRFLQSSFIVRLVEGNERNIKDHLQHLFHRGLVNRFQFERNREFCYYVDASPTIKLLLQHQFALTDQMQEWVRLNRDRDYAAAVQKQEHGKLFFIEHELMISRFHAMLELGCRASGGTVELITWQQGAIIEHSVEVPAMRYEDGQWYELEGTERLPHRPDGFFTLRFPKAPEGSNKANFFYEADQGTMTTTDMKKKFRAHFHFVAKKRLHEQLYGIRRVRAVVVEAITTKRAQLLRHTSKDPVVSGNKPSPLFWFTTAELYTKTKEVKEDGRTVKRPVYLLHPEILFKQIWASPAEDRLLSLMD